MRRGKASLLLLAVSLGTAVLMIVWPVKTAQPFQTAQAVRGDLAYSLQLNGKVCNTPQQPCISPKSGKVYAVYAAAGQSVAAGELLFVLDTAAEERMLASLYASMQQLEYFLQDAEQPAMALLAQNRLELLKLENQLLAAIEASQIRAASDGIVQAIYVQPGDVVMEKTMLGMVCGGDTEIVAAGQAADLEKLLPGMAAVGVGEDGKALPLVLSHMYSPDGKLGTQSAVFQYRDDEKRFKSGEHVEIELVTDVVPDQTLIPLSAVDAENRVWFWEKGNVCFQQLRTVACNRYYAAVPEAWEGREVILYPDRYGLQN